MIEIPAFRVTQGQAATYTFTWTGKNLTSHVGTVTVKALPQGAVIDTVTAVMDAAGLVTFTFTATDTAAFPALAKVGYFVTGWFELKITGATNNETFQGPLAVAGAL